MPVYLTSLNLTCCSVSCSTALVAPAAPEAQHGQHDRGGPGRQLGHRLAGLRRVRVGERVVLALGQHLRGLEFVEARVVVGGQDCPGELGDLQVVLRLLRRRRRRARGLRDRRRLVRVAGEEEVTADAEPGQHDDRDHDRDDLLAALRRRGLERRLRALRDPVGVGRELRAAPRRARCPGSARSRASAAPAAGPAGGTGAPAGGTRPSPGPAAGTRRRPAAAARPARPACGRRRRPGPAPSPAGPRPG